MTGADGETDGPSDQRIAEARAKLEEAKQALRESEAAWDDDDFVAALSRKPKEEREAAFQQRLEIGEKILAIGNARFELIVSQVRDNTQELEAATDDVNGALGRLQDVDRVLTAVSSLLSIVARILV